MLTGYIGLLILDLVLSQRFPFISAFFCSKHLPSSLNTADIVYRRRSQVLTRENPDIQLHAEQNAPEPNPRPSDNPGCPASGSGFLPIDPLANPSGEETPELPRPGPAGPIQPLRQGGSALRSPATTGGGPHQTQLPPYRPDYAHALGYTDNFGHMYHSVDLESEPKCPQVIAAEALFAKNATEEVQTMLCLRPQAVIDPTLDIRPGREGSFTVDAMVIPLFTPF